MKKYIPLIKCFIIYFAFQCLFYFGSKLLLGEPHLIHSALDDKIPYISFFVLFYMLWWGYLFLVPFFLYQKDNKKLNRLFLSMIISIIVCNIFFVIYPSTVIRQTNLSNDFFDFCVKQIYFFDNPAVNCLPSMHCLFSFLFIFSTWNNKNINKGLQIILLVTNIGICLSTLFIKQHAVLDLITAFPVALIIWLTTKYIKSDYLKLVNKKG